MQFTLNIKEKKKSINRRNVLLMLKKRNKIKIKMNNNVIYEKNNCLIKKIKKSNQKISQ